MTSRLAPCGLHYRGGCICAAVHAALGEEAAERHPERGISQAGRSRIAVSARGRAKKYAPRKLLSSPPPVGSVAARKASAERSRAVTAAARQRAAEAVQRAKAKLEADRKARIERQARDVRTCVTCGARWCRLSISGANAKYCSPTCAEAKWHGKKSA